MYYTPASQNSSFFNQAVAAPDGPSSKKRSRMGWWIGSGIVALVVAGGVGWATSRIPAVNVNHPATLGVSSISATPQPAGVTFGDLLKEKPNYTGWLVGIKAGTVILVQSQTGAINTVATAPNAWYGPISTPVWSPDHTQLAYLTLPAEDAVGLTANPQVFAQKMGLVNIPTASTFPFGLMTILDIATKQIKQTTVEIRNTPRNIVWLDNESLAAVGQTIVTYHLATDQTTTVTASGNTTAGEQLQSPLAWDSASQTLYFTKVKQEDSGLNVRLVVGMNLKTNEVTEMQLLKSGAFDDVTTSQGIDIALSTDGSRLAEVGDQGVSYVTVADGGVHSLPYSDDWLWLKQSTISDLTWLAPDKLAFTSQATDGSKVWGVWDIPHSEVISFGKGAFDGSWDVTSGRLALLEPDGKSVGILTPHWTDPTTSPLQTLPLDWDDLSW